MTRNRVRHSCILLLLFVISLICCLQFPAQASNDWQSRPGTVAYTRLLPDNTSVLLDGMVVAETGIPDILVKDPWSGEDYLSVNVGARQIEEGTSVEITGYTAIVDGEVTVVATGVWQYLTPNGRPFIMMPKGMDEPIEWSDMGEIPIDENQESQTPPSNRMGFQTEFLESIPVSGTIPWAKSLDDDTPLGEEPLTGKIVTATPTDFPGVFYIEEPNRCAGIRVVYSGSVELTRGYTVTVGGTVETGADGEREIVADAADVVISETTTELTPLGITNLGLGLSHNLDTTGLLIKTWGRVTAMDPQNTFFDINDGSSTDSIKVNWLWPTLTPPELDSQVTVIGISGLADNARLLRPRDANDIVRQEPPVPTVTGPIGSTSDIAPVVTWTAPVDFDQYRVTVTNVGEPADSWDSDAVAGTDLSAQVQHALTDAATYSVRVAIHSSCGWGWSEPAQFTVTFGEPPLAQSVSYCPIP